jgi:hypothetical protein
MAAQSRVAIDKEGAVKTRKTASVIASTVCLSVVLAAADGQALTLSPEIELAAEGFQPAIATAAEGNTLITWLTGGFGTPHHVAIRRLRGSGELEEATELSAPGTGELRAGAGGSGFVLTWWDSSSEGPRVFTQRVRANGSPVAGGPRAIVRSHLEPPTLALGVAPDGRYAVLFTDARALGEEGAVSATVRLARFQADGRRIGSIVRLAGGERSLEEQTRIAGGVAVGDEFVLAGSTAFSGCESEGSPDVRAAVARVPWTGSGAPAVTSFADGRDCDGGPVLAGLLSSRFGPLAVLSGHNYNLQRFDAASGTPVGARRVFAELENPACEGGLCRSLAAIAGDGRGRFVLAWEIRDQDGTYTLAVQLRGRDGGEQSDFIVVNDEASLRPTRPALTLTDNGTVRVVWEHAEDPDIQEKAAAIHMRVVKID